jgi:hypothetical protein
MPLQALGNDPSGNATVDPLPSAQTPQSHPHRAIQSAEFSLQSFAPLAPFVVPLFDSGSAGLGRCFTGRKWNSRLVVSSSSPSKSAAMPYTKNAALVGAHRLSASHQHGGHTHHVRCCKIDLCLPRSPARHDASLRLDLSTRQA